MAAPTETVQKPLEKYVHPPETKHKLKYADLITLDMADFDRPGGKERLAAQLKETAHKTGFFYITNFGITQEQIDQQFAIAKEFFSLPEEERLKFRAPLEEGIYNGYRPLGAIELLPGLYDNLETYNISKFIPEKQRSQPEVIKRYWADIEKFHRHMHENIAHKLLKLLAIILELDDEDEFVKGHLYESNCDSSLRYMKYHARTGEENTKFKNTYIKGHADKGTMTFVFQQPVAALQVQKTDESDWEHVRIQPGVVAVNIARILHLLTNGYFKGGMHRVIAPPEDQACIDRLGLLYFVLPSDQIKMKAMDSPFLRRMGYGKKEGSIDLDIPANEWVRDRFRNNWLPFDQRPSKKI
ncbi:hypothetical protein ASPWEDRAFT_510244 [Aspergillus wentii DTO 134E9]|uniref:Fe2OG dioxygenase domain-containing protein n=1 Tax=Aspergillus wentii DTO 134E9 TaxID=1073089 RepID=A0A1L9RKJ5_ASPWE|nr:uncharacterized protein ASPWEDRAFT_510244 [Aspergillus wentii DTO 134E9]OJJ35459.1 hypothetical protein ASPWEDRAFT_510244 [Aspergillus wentii DTO 134E9]